MLGLKKAFREERLTARYLMKRRFYAGQVRTIVESKNRRFGFVHVLLWMAVGGTQILYYSVGYLIALLRGRDTIKLRRSNWGRCGKAPVFLSPKYILRAEQRRRGENNVWHSRLVWRHTKRAGRSCTR